MNTKMKGKYGEDLAVSYLTKKGFEIIERNYRHEKGEIDIIALIDNALLIFIEVKLRKSSQFGKPESFVTDNQKKTILTAAENYIFAINWKKDIRFDIIAIQHETIEHIEDAFY